MLSQTQPLIMGFSQATAQDSNQAKAAKQEDRQTCLPVTIRAVEVALEDCGMNTEALRIHGAEHGMLVMVGVVESLTRQATSLEFSLNDGTGRIKSRLYVSDGQSKSFDEIAVGQYVSVFGNARTAPSVHFAVTGMRLVQSADELSYHMIECAHAALKLRRGVVDPTTPQPKKVVSDGMQEMPFQQGGKVGMANAVAQAPGVTASQAPLSGGDLRAALLAFLKTEAGSHPEGSSLQSVIAHAKTTPSDAVRKSLENLVDDGEVFTTIDDEHFSCV